MPWGCWSHQWSRCGKHFTGCSSHPPRGTTSITSSAPAAAAASWCNRSSSSWQWQPRHTWFCWWCGPFASNRNLASRLGITWQRDSWVFLYFPTFNVSVLCFDKHPLSGSTPSCREPRMPRLVRYSQSWKRYTIGRRSVVWPVLWTWSAWNLLVFKTTLHYRSWKVWKPWMLPKKLHPRRPQTVIPYQRGIVCTMTKQWPRIFPPSCPPPCYNHPGFLSVRFVRIRLEVACRVATASPIRSTRKTTETGSVGSALTWMLDLMQSAMSTLDYRTVGLISRASPTDWRRYSLHRVFCFSLCKAWQNKWSQGAGIAITLKENSSNWESA